MPDGEKIFRNFLSLWKSLPRDSNGLPRRNGLGPGLAPALMPHLFLARVQGEYEIEIRLMGSALEGKAGMQLTGSNYFDQLARESWRFYEDFINGYRLHPCAGRIARHVGSREGLTYDLHTLAAPLADEAGEASFIVGVSYMRANHEESAGRRGSGLGAIAAGDALVVEARYIDLGFGTPAALPAY